MAKEKQDDQLEPTYSSYVRIRYVALKTCQRQWTLGRSGERGSVISVLAARHDDDDDDDDDEFNWGFLQLLDTVAALPGTLVISNFFNDWWTMEE